MDISPSKDPSAHLGDGDQECLHSREDATHESKEESCDESISSPIVRKRHHLDTASKKGFTSYLRHPLPLL